MRSVRCSRSSRQAIRGENGGNETGCSRISNDSGKTSLVQPPGEPAIAEKIPVTRTIPPAIRLGIVGSSDLQTGSVATHRD